MLDCKQCLPAVLVGGLRAALVASRAAAANGARGRAHHAAWPAQRLAERRGRLAKRRLVVRAIDDPGQLSPRTTGVQRCTVPRPGSENAAPLFTNRLIHARSFVAHGKMSIAALLEAAEYLERRERGAYEEAPPSATTVPCSDPRLISCSSRHYERVCFRVAEAEHGYASTLPMPEDGRSFSMKRQKSKKTQGNRSGTKFPQKRTGKIAET